MGKQFKNNFSKYLLTTKIQKNQLSKKKMTKNKIFMAIFYIIIFVSCITILVTSWSHWIEYKNMKELQEKIPLNWSKNLITSIHIIKNDEDCNEQYQLIAQAQLFEQKSQDIYFQQYQKDPIQFFTSQTDQIQNINQKKSINSFAFIDKSQNELKYWKMCVKYMTDINFSSKKNQLLGLCETNEKICPAENNKIVCILNQFQCPSNTNNFCPPDKKQCVANTKIECVNYEDNCPQEDLNKKCLPSQKVCIIQDRVLCQDAQEKCPIVDILIQEKSSQTPEGYEEELISFDSNQKLLVKRNDPLKWPVVEVAIQNIQNTCIINNNQIQNLFKISNGICQLNTCVDGIDSRYEDIYQESISTKQLFQSNNLIKQNEDINPEFDHQFKIFQRKYFYFNTTCGHSNDFDGYNVNYQQIIGNVNVIIQFAIILLIIKNIMIHLYLSITKKNNKFQRSLIYLREFNYLMILTLSIFDIILLHYLDNKYINKQLSYSKFLLNGECNDIYVQQNIEDILDQLNTLKKLWNQNFIQSIVNSVFLLINTIFEIQVSKQYRNQYGIIITSYICWTSSENSCFKNTKGSSNNQSSDKKCQQDHFKCCRCCYEGVGDLFQCIGECCESVGKCIRKCCQIVGECICKYVGKCCKCITKCCQCFGEDLSKCCQCFGKLLWQYIGKFCQCVGKCCKCVGESICKYVGYCCKCIGKCCQCVREILNKCIEECCKCVEKCCNTVGESLSKCFGECCKYFGKCCQCIGEFLCKYIGKFCQCIGKCCKCFCNCLGECCNCFGEICNGCCECVGECCKCFGQCCECVLMCCTCCGELEDD